MRAESKTISIVGCGWLGLPLGRRLVERGHQVRGSTTSPEKLDALRDAGIEAHHVAFEPELRGDPGALFDSEVLFLNIPPPRVDDVVEVHRRQAHHVVERVQEGGVGFVILASTTGVYPTVNREVTEDDAGAPDGRETR